MSRARLGAVVAAAALLALTVLVWLPVGPVTRLDARVDRSVHGWTLRHLWAEHAAKLVTQLGSPLVVTAVTVLAAVLAWWSGRRRLAAYLVLVRATAWALTGLLKVVVDRPRPRFALVHAGGGAFPSGHSSGAAALFLSLAVGWGWSRGSGGLRRAVVATAVVLAVLVALSRIVLGVHFPTDVVAGLALGWGTALAFAGVPSGHRGPGSPTIAADRSKVNAG